MAGHGVKSLSFDLKVFESEEGRGQTFKIRLSRKRCHP